MTCRNCGAEVTETVLDLYHSPISNQLIRRSEIDKVEYTYPLKMLVCNQCWLVQINDYSKSNAEIFNHEYVYFSSFSTSWVEHARKYVEDIINKCQLTSGSKVIEIGSNDGYLLQFFVEKGISCLGIDPSTSTAEAAAKKGVQTLGEFFSDRLAIEMGPEEAADLIICNNVLAHVPDINNFVKGLKTLLKSSGTVTIEFPYLLELIKNNQFDTVYHEHFSYFSLSVVERIFKKHGFQIVDLQRLETHGGSLRLYVMHVEHQVNTKLIVSEVLRYEQVDQINSLNYYQEFRRRVLEVKINFLDWIIQAKKNKKRIVGYGAAAKATTFLNYIGIKVDMLECVADLSPYKQNRYIPGTEIPIVSPNTMIAMKPDYIIIFAWNLKQEIISYLNEVVTDKVGIVTAIPKLETVYISGKDR